MEGKVGHDLELLAGQMQVSQVLAHNRYPRLLAEARPKKRNQSWIELYGDDPRAGPCSLMSYRPVTGPQVEDQIFRVYSRFG